MKMLISAAVGAILSTTVYAQEAYVGGSLDYHFPHSGDAQIVGSLIGGLVIDAGPFAVVGEAE